MNAGGQYLFCILLHVDSNLFLQNTTACVALSPIKLYFHIAHSLSQALNEQ